MQPKEQADLGKLIVLIEKLRFGMQIYFAPMGGITDGILRRVHHELFGWVDVYGLSCYARSRKNRKTAKLALRK